MIPIPYPYQSNFCRHWHDVSWWCGGELRFFYGNVNCELWAKRSNGHCMRGWASVWPSRIRWQLSSERRFYHVLPTEDAYTVPCKKAFPTASAAIDNCQHCGESHDQKTQMVNSVWSMEIHYVPRNNQKPGMCESILVDRTRRLLMPYSKNEPLDHNGSSYVSLAEAVPNECV